MRDHLFGHREECASVKDHMLICGKSGTGSAGSADGYWEPAEVHGTMILMLHCAHGCCLIEASWHQGKQAGFAQMFRRQGPKPQGQWTRCMTIRMHSRNPWLQRCLQGLEKLVHLFLQPWSPLHSRSRRPLR